MGGAIPGTAWARVAQFVAQMSMARSWVRQGRQVGLGHAGVGGFGLHLRRRGIGYEERISRGWGSRCGRPGGG